MTSLTRFDLIGAFLIGAAIATGNPALQDLGLVSIVLPVLLVIILAATSVQSGEALQRGFRWLGAAYIAFILLWYEQYKLFGHPGSVDLFTTLTDWLGFHGHEKFMRIGVASCEIIASIVILTPPVQGLGAIGALMLMSGAMFFHLVSPLGTDPYGDGGILFKEACSVWTTAWVVLFWQREQVAAIARRFGVPVPAWI
ncbi:hypothetical protein GCM10011611_56230 [Aliidongia dinghuensis]|uniref:DoxX family protein n=1 Tax=Aliidongia dinghuensis TaxID=1867774 RepID=A0A8J2YYS4_9PROT|nr:hypothetical protein [Aliidongia dinghuensis]GGF42545.1 hypothetical protein GCM10011611_56230 [Aliidongia dinghuensis]